MAYARSCWVCGLLLVACGDSGPANDSSTSGDDTTTTSSVPTSDADTSTSDEDPSTSDEGTTCPDEFEPDPPGPPPGTCEPEDPGLEIWAGLSPCADDTCTKFDSWTAEFLPDQDNVVDVDLWCDVGERESLCDMRERWILEGCSGMGAPAGGRVELSFGVTPGGPLDVQPGDRVQIAYQAWTEEWSHWSHRSWSLRREDGTVLVLRSDGQGLPPERVAMPLIFGGGPDKCHEFNACGGPSEVTGPTRLHVALDAFDVSVLDGQARVLPSDPGYDVILVTGSYGMNVVCGEFSDWETYDLAVVLRP